MREKEEERGRERSNEGGRGGRGGMREGEEREAEREREGERNNIRVERSKKKLDRSLLLYKLPGCIWQWTLYSFCLKEARAQVSFVVAV